MLSLAYEISSVDPAAIPRGAIELDALDLTMAAGLILIAGLVSIVLGLRQEKRFLIASFRTVFQLLLVGFILKHVFALNQWWAIAAVAAVMIAAASWEASSDTTERSRGRPTRSERSVRS